MSDSSTISEEASDSSNKTWEEVIADLLATHKEAVIAGLKQAHIVPLLSFLEDSEQLFYSDSSYEFGSCVEQSGILAQITPEMKAEIQKLVDENKDEMKLHGAQILLTMLMQKEFAEECNKIIALLEKNNIDRNSHEMQIILKFMQAKDSDAMIALEKDPAFPVVVLLKKIALLNMAHFPAELYNTILTNIVGEFKFKHTQFAGVIEKISEFNSIQPQSAPMIEANAILREALDGKDKVEIDVHKIFSLLSKLDGAALDASKKTLITNLVAMWNDYVEKIGQKILSPEYDETRKFLVGLHHLLKQLDNPAVKLDLEKTQAIMVALYADMLAKSAQVNLFLQVAEQHRHTPAIEPDTVAAAPVNGPDPFAGFDGDFTGEENNPAAANTATNPEATSAPAAAATTTALAARVQALKSQQQENGPSADPVLPSGAHQGGGQRKWKFEVKPPQLVGRGYIPKPQKPKR